jgi:hypothetical protein
MKFDYQIIATVNALRNREYLAVVGGAPTALTLKTLTKEQL